MILSKQGSEFYNNFTKEVFNTVKGIDNERGDFIIQTYENLYNRLSEDDTGSSAKVPAVDLAKLREDLSHVRGIGGQRLDEIMAVIERHLRPEPASDTDTAVSAGKNTASPKE